MSRPDWRAIERYVAIGDSSTEGMEDPDGQGGYRGWADRLAERIAAERGGLMYANLAVRGRRTRQIRDAQLPRALDLAPDLVTLFTGTNDIVARRFEVAEVAADVEWMQRRLVAAGATVLGFTLPDIAPVMPLGRLVAPRLRRLNRELRRVSAETGTLLVDFAAHPVASDPRLWHDDRLHANARGHARIAAALAQALGLPCADGSWTEPLPPPDRCGARERLARELGWARRYLLPWLWRHLRGRSSGDARGPKRPALTPVDPPSIGLGSATRAS